MENVFDQMLERQIAKKEEKLGNPWNYIPIKNNKGAQECTELHMSKQNLHGVTNFEVFPNLECLWLNENKLAKVENLD